MAEVILPEPGPMNAYHRFIGIPLSRIFAWIFFTLFGPTLVFGSRRVPKKGGLLILSNHQADVDPVLVQLGCRRPIHFMAKSELFEMKWLRKWLIRHYAFPVNRGEPDRNAIKRAIALLKLGECVCVFPEGELSDTGEILPLKPGVALLVRLSGAQVMCCGLSNSRRIIPYGSMIPRPAFRVVRERWGEARTFDKKVENEEIMEWAKQEILRLSGQPEKPPGTADRQIGGASDEPEA